MIYDYTAIDRFVYLSPKAGFQCPARTLTPPRPLYSIHVIIHFISEHYILDQNQIFVKMMTIVNQPLIIVVILNVASQDVSWSCHTIGYRGLSRNQEKVTYLEPFEGVKQIAFDGAHSDHERNWIDCTWTLYSNSSQVNYIHMT